MQDRAICEPQVIEFLRTVFAATHLELDFTLTHQPNTVPVLAVEFTGPDTRYLTARNAELLKAIEHLTAKVIGLDSDQHDLLSCDAEHFKINRDRALLASARRAADQVRETGLPFTFSPMSSHERRQLHLLLTEMGLETASTGEGPARRVILYPPILVAR